MFMPRIPEENFRMITSFASLIFQQPLKSTERNLNENFSTKNCQSIHLVNFITSKTTYNPLQFTGNEWHILIMIQEIKPHLSELKSFCVFLSRLIDPMNIATEPCTL